MAYENTGYLAFANALSNAGQNIGNALTQRYENERKQQYLTDLAPLAKEGNWTGISELAFQRGDADLGLKALAQASEQKKLADQRAYDAQALGLAAGGASATGVTGGVTPNPQPMNLPGSAFNNGKAIYDMAIAKGAQPNEAALLASAAGAESNYNPTAVHDNGTGYGMFGHRLDRRDAMFKTYGTNTPSQDQQVEFALNELRNRPEGRMALAAKTPEELTAAQMFFERPRGFTENNPRGGDNYSGRLALTQQFFPGASPVGAPRVQVADASGAIPASAMPQPQGGQPQPDNSEMARHAARRDNALRALSMQGISDNARAQAKAILDDANNQLDRLDRRANQQKPDVRQFGDTIYRVDAQGNLAPVQKVEKSPQEKALTADQSNAAGFADRMDNAEKVIANPDLQASIMGTAGTANKALGMVPAIGAKWQDAEFKRYSRAKKDFITAVLRKESGAAIGADEFQAEDEKYFPQPWDDPQTIEDKTQARQIAIASMRRASGPAQGQGQPAATGSLQPLPANVLDEARAAIAVKGRDAVVNRLKERGFDTSGL